MNKSYRGRAIGIMILGLLLAGSANAATLTVCKSGCAYSSIQAAINASSSGDTIQVQSGTYYENVNVNKQLTLRGIGVPVVDAKGIGSPITLSANGITLEGFTATGSRGGSYDVVAGINVTSSNNTLNDNNVSNNGYGIYLDYSSNNKLSGNHASSNSAGIYLDYSSNNKLSGNNASSNKHLGINLYSSSNNTLSGNNPSNSVEGIYLDYSSNNNMLSGNYVSNNGYGIFLDYSSNNTLSGNNASLNNYAGIYLDYSSNNTLSGNIMTVNGNNFGLYGGSDSDFDNQIDTSNLVDGKPVYYIAGLVL